MKYISKKVISIGLPLVQTFTESLRNIPDGTLVAFTTLVLNQSTPLSLFASSYKNVTITTRLTDTHLTDNHRQNSVNDFSELFT